MKQLKEIFDIKYGVNLELINCDIIDNGIPFVARGRKNNGVVALVKKIEGKNANPAHTISVAVSGSVGSSFYHNYDYYSGRDIYILIPRNEMSVQEMLFYCYVIEKNKYKYNYGRALNKTLPFLVVPSKIPKNFHKIEMPAMPSKKAVIAKQKTLNPVKWKYFLLQDLFPEIERGGDVLQADYEEGKIPLISAIMGNNGVKQYVKHGNKVIKGKIITIPVMGKGAGQAFYQKNDCYISSNVNVLRSNFLNEYVGLFISTLIRKERIQFNYGRILNQKRLKKLKIKLPVDSNSKPDFALMESYIKSLPYSSNL